MKNFIERFKRRHAEPTFTATLGEIDSFKHLVMTSPCPGCGQKTVKVGMFGRGPDGWEASVSCRNCDMKGIVNSTGFKFEKLEKDGKGAK
jgi:hypothetical protein